jgi:alpha-1,6-mannosyltransferase
VGYSRNDRRQPQRKDTEVNCLPIKTLHITNCYHASSGGIRTFYRALLHAANQRQREIRLVVPGPKDSVEEVGEFARIYTIGAPGSPFVDSTYRLLLPHLYALPYRSRLRRILEEERPDLVEVCDKYTLCFLPTMLRRGWIEGAPQAVLVGLSCERMDDNVSAYVSPGVLGRRFANWYMRTVYAPRFDCHISNSQYTAGELRDALAERPDLPVHVCPMGTDCENLSPQRREPKKREALLAAFRNKTSAGVNTRLLLYVGRISREKNISLLLKMMELLEDQDSAKYRLLIVGAGPLANWLEANAERRVPGRVHLLGHVADRECLADIFANCDALIHPNPREPFGIAPLEAMASGLPVIAPIAGGVLSYANEQNSWLAEPNGDSFANAVRRTFDDESARQTKVSRAIHTASEFSWSRTTAHFFDLYDSLHMRFRNSAGKRYLRLCTPEALNLPVLNKSLARSEFLSGTGFGTCDSGEKSF